MSKAELPKQTPPQEFAPANDVETPIAAAPTMDDLRAIFDASPTWPPGFFGAFAQLQAKKNGSEQPTENFSND